MNNSEFRVDGKHVIGRSNVRSHVYLKLEIGIYIVGTGKIFIQLTFIHIKLVEFVTNPNKYLKVYSSQKPLILK